MSTTRPTHNDSPTTARNAGFRALGLTRAQEVGLFDLLARAGAFDYSENEVRDMELCNAISERGVAQGRRGWRWADKATGRHLAAFNKRMEREFRALCAGVRAGRIAI